MNYLTDMDGTFRIIVTAGWANESSGDVEATTGYFSRVSISMSELPELLAACDLDCLDEQGLPYPEPGHYFVREDSLGFVYVYCGTESEVKDAYVEAEERFGQWCHNGHVWDVQPSGQIRVCRKCKTREAYWDDDEYPDNPCPNKAD